MDHGLQQADHEDIRSLLAAGVIDERSASHAFSILEQTATRTHWIDFGKRGLLGLGALHLLAGVVFFFAGNWSLLTKWERLVPIFTLMVLSAILSWLRSETLVGQVCLMVSTVLVGVFMAVFGQVYQTGADAWTLFAYWAALSAIWVRASRFYPLFGLWLVVVQTGVALYAQQVLVLKAYEWSFACAIVCVFALGVNQVVSGMAPRWFRRLIVINVICMLLLPMIESDVAVLSCIVGFVLVIVAWRKGGLQDFFHVTAAVGLGIFAATVLLSKHVLSPRAGHFEVFFVLGGFIALSVGGAVSWLRREWNERQC